MVAPEPAGARGSSPRPADVVFVLWAGRRAVWPMLWRGLVCWCLCMPLLHVAVPWAGGLGQVGSRGAICGLRNDFVSRLSPRARLELRKSAACVVCTVSVTHRLRL